MGFKLFAKSLFSRPARCPAAMFTRTTAARGFVTLMLGLAAATVLAAPSSASIVNSDSRPNSSGASASLQETELCQYCHSSRKASNRTIGDATEASCLFYGEKVIGTVKCSSCHKPICRQP